MLLSLDLTTRQATRVLEQALRNKAKLEIDPRPEFVDSPLWGTLTGRENDLLAITLMNTGPAVPLNTLVGAMCDVRTILSGQLYLFTTVVVDASNTTAPRRLTLASPDLIQVANRRRFARKSPTEPVPVRLTVPSAPEPFVANLANISRSGLGCRVLRKELDELLLIGDELNVEFVLPWVSQVFNFVAEICTKTPCQDPDHMLVGLEFKTHTAAAQATADLLRAALDNETQRLIETDGDEL
jgi:hypothetical protein